MTKAARKSTGPYVYTVKQGRYEHIAIAEKALGRPLPHGAQVHHVDENKRNNARANLVICQDNAYHALLHVRAKVVRAGGNPNTEALCCRCLQIKPRADFNNRNRGNGIMNYCRVCQSIYFRTYTRKSRSKYIQSNQPLYRLPRRNSSSVPAAQEP